MHSNGVMSTRVTRCSAATFLSPVFATTSIILDGGNSQNLMSWTPTRHEVGVQPFGLAGTRRAKRKPTCLDPRRACQGRRPTPERPRMNVDRSRQFSLTMELGSSPSEGLPSQQKFLLTGVNYAAVV